MIDREDSRRYDHIADLQVWHERTAESGGDHKFRESRFAEKLLGGFAGAFAADTGDVNANPRQAPD